MTDTQHAAASMTAAGSKVKADDIAAPFRDTLRATVAGLDVKPKLVGFLANSDPAARKYAEWTARAFEGDGLRYELRVGNACF